MRIYRGYKAPRMRGIVLKSHLSNFLKARDFSAAHAFCAPVASICSAQSMTSRRTSRVGTLAFFLRELGVHGGAEAGHCHIPCVRLNFSCRGEQQRCRRMTEHRICRCIHLSFLRILPVAGRPLHHEESDGGNLITSRSGWLPVEQKSPRTSHRVGTDNFSNVTFRTARFDHVAVAAAISAKQRA
ncbi:hypothetical protein KCP71_20630 [Salmonella enterica subsp. enterica]|nr:hypothetical protein KCP71_20630 [Salmonella enterica subsp. enterica]